MPAGPDGLLGLLGMLGPERFTCRVPAMPAPAASQVHAAVLRGSNKEVVIKVLKPGVEDVLTTGEACKEHGIMWRLLHSGTAGTGLPATTQSRVPSMWRRLHSGAAGAGSPTPPPRSLTC